MKKFFKHGVFLKKRNGTKWFLTMRLTLIIILASMLKLSASVYSQETRLNLNLRNVSIVEALNEVEQNSEFKFLYRLDQLDLNKKINLLVKDEKVENIVKEIFEKENVTIDFLNNNLIVISQIEQQANKVTGKVTDSKGDPVPMATIVVEGTTTGTAADMDGNFSIEVPDPSKNLVVSFIGLKTQVISIEGRTVINVTMEEASIGIDEVIAIGYGTMKKSDITGSVGSVTSADFERQPISRIGQALQGRSAGVHVTQNSGAPGAGFKVRVRGTNSINGSNEPLYVVDGLVASNINSINVNDIKAMEILKDASATAIYGSRGANGVILITTKDGKRGGLKVSFDSYYTVSTVPKKLSIMNGADFAEGVNFAAASGGGAEPFSASDIAELRANGGEDWQDEVFRTAGLSNSQLSISGGTDAIDFYVSANYLDQEGIVIGSDLKRYNFLSKINADLSSKIKVGVNLNGSRAVEEGQPADLANALTFAPSTTVYDENGNYNFNSEKEVGPNIISVGTGGTNPVMLSNLNIRDQVTDRLVASAYLNYQITKDLVFNTSVGFENQYATLGTYSPRIINGIGKAQVNKVQSSRLQNTNILTYNKQINSKHRIKVDAIYEQSISRFARINSNASNFFSDNTTYKKMELAAIQRVSNLSYSESLSSYVGRVNYSISEKYLITGTVRADGSSKFQKDKWGIFPSGSLAWRMSEEGFIQDIDFISNLKLRGSYGVTGSQAIAALATRAIPLLGVNYNYPFSGGATTIGVAPSDKIANPDLSWEETAQTNLGLDFGLFSSKLNVSFDWYKKNTTDLLLDVTLPAFVGANLITQNIGEVENKGFEFSIGAIVVDNNDFKISSNLNFSTNKNEVISLVDGSPIEKGKEYFNSTLPVPPTRVEVGLPISSFRGYVFEGVYQLGEEDEAASFGRLVGDAKYKDQLTVDTDGDGIADAGDGIISTDDITTVGDGNPDFTWGLNTTITYRKFDCNLLIQGSHGNDVYNFTRARQMSLGAGTWHAVHEDYKNRWTTENPSNIPSGRDGTEVLSSQFIEDGSFVRLRNISLSYTLDNNNLMNKLGIGSVRLYTSAENLFVLTKYRGFDPESSVTGDSDVDLGIDFNAYPQARSITFGLNIAF